MPPPNRSKVPIGTVLEGKFRVTKEIGRGGMAAVYEAENIDIGKRVAVKILAAELLTSRVVRERFIREARASAAIRSPHICDVYDSGMYDERPFLVMELLEGESLYDLLTRKHRLDIETTLTVATHSCRGLTRAHELNVVHRDLKPENIFLTRNEEGETIAKILDFGLAKFYEPTGGDAEQARLTREGALFGTPAYMSPEQAKGQGEVDHRCDLWALGCIVYECLTGQTVWNVDQGVAMILAQIAGAPIPKPSRLRPDLPPNFEAWFLKALDRDPDKRFQTAREFAEALAQALKPQPGSTRAPLASTELEGRAVDELISSELVSAELLSGASQPLVGPPPAPSSQPVSTQNVDLPPPSGAARGAERGPGRALAVLLVTALLALGGYAVWLDVLHPPPSKAVAIAVQSARPAASHDSGEPHESFKPRESDPYALQIASAQNWLVRGNRDNAMKMFKEAFNNGGTGVSRSLLAQAGVALAKNDDRCQVTGLGRPRPFDLVAPVSRPTLAVTPVGLVAAWVDSHQDKTRRQGFATVLDSALRRVSPARLITPESTAVRHPQLLAAGNRLAFIYWDGAGDEPGVYVRLLETDGRIAGPARRISEVKRNEFYPALVRVGDGTFWAVWEEDVDPGGEDLMARRLNADLEPMYKAVRLTAFVHKRGGTTSAGKPDVAIAHDQINIVFSLQHGKQDSQIMRLRIALSDPALKTGVVDEKPKKGKHGKKKTEDRFIGDLRPVSTAHGKNAQPRIACTKEGCFAVWDDEKAGALASFLDRDKGQAIWRREFASKGSRPAIAASAGGAMVAWYEASRLRLARITRDGIEKSSILARVSGYQPYPAIVAGSEANQWYIIWRDYEAGHREAFVVRAQCK